jgi:hypothetical protein
MTFSAVKLWINYGGHGCFAKKADAIAYLQRKGLLANESGPTDADYLAALGPCGK